MIAVECVVLMAKQESKGLEDIGRLSTLKTLEIFQNDQHTV